MEQPPATSLVQVTDVFCEDDTFISNEYPDKNEADTKILQTGHSGRYDILLKFQIPDFEDRSIEDIQLCLYQFYAKSSIENDEVTLILIDDNWTRESVTWRTQPQITADSFSPDLPKTSGKVCITVWPSSLSRSYAYILIGKDNRYFYSSRWTSAPNGVDNISTSNIYHPHLSISTVLSTAPTSPPISPPPISPAPISPAPVSSPPISSPHISSSPIHSPPIYSPPIYSPPIYSPSIRPMSSSPNVVAPFMSGSADKQTTTFPYVPLILGFATASAIVLIMGLLIYFRKRRKKKQKHNDNIYQNYMKRGEMQENPNSAVEYSYGDYTNSTKALKDNNVACPDKLLNWMNDGNSSDVCSSLSGINFGDEFHLDKLQEKELPGILKNKNVMRTEKHIYAGPEGGLRDNRREGIKVNKQKYKNRDINYMESRGKTPDVKKPCQANPSTVLNDLESLEHAMNSKSSSKSTEMRRLTDIVFTGSGADNSAAEITLSSQTMKTDDRLSKNSNSKEGGLFPFSVSDMSNSLLVNRKSTSSDKYPSTVHTTTDSSNPSGISGSFSGTMTTLAPASSSFPSTCEFSTNGPKDSMTTRTTNTFSFPGRETGENKTEHGQDLFQDTYLDSMTADISKIDDETEGNTLNTINTFNSIDYPWNPCRIPDCTSASSERVFSSRNGGMPTNVITTIQERKI